MMSLVEKTGLLFSVTHFYCCREEDDLVKTFQGFSDLLRPGGAFLLDFRNFQSVVERGYVIKNGAHPACKVWKINVCGVYQRN